MSQATYSNLIQAFRAHKNPEIAEHSTRFFKTGKGEYGEGDCFLGIRVPTIRKTAAEHRGLSLADTRRLLKSRYHEERLLAAIMLVNTFKRADAAGRQEIFDLYLAHTDYLNGWDIVDCSAPQIVGGFLENQDHQVLFDLAASEVLWERRIAMLACFHDIRRGEFKTALAICEQLVQDPEDLIHKAVGWMLREIGKRDRAAEERFLRKHHRTMPRTMLRYAIERFSKVERTAWLKR